MIVSSIIQYESGEMDTTETVEFFAELIKSGMAYNLQGSYGRMANALIERGLISSDGVVNYDELEEVLYE